VQRRRAAIRPNADFGMRIADPLMADGGSWFVACDSLLALAGKLDGVQAREYNHQWRSSIDDGDGNRTTLRTTYQAAACG